MNGHHAKKLRQIGERQFSRQLEDLKREFMRRMDEVVKKPPPFFPKGLWYRLAQIFLNI